MDVFQEFISSYGIYLSTLLISIASGFVPFINSELFLIVVTLSAGRMDILPVAAVAALGQMIAKVIMYLSGRGIFKVTFKKYEEKVDAMMKKLHQWENKLDLILFLSAFVGFPPFYVLTVALGAARHHFIRFIVVGFAGRLLRFVLIMLFPQYFKQWVV